VKKVKAWYFVTDERKLGYNDNRKIVIGETHTVTGVPKLCKNGLHASERIIDALKYAPGAILYEVELSGDFDVGDDKLCATERTYHRSIDATSLLGHFARKQALINIEKIKPYCGADDYSLIINYLTTGDEELLLATRSAARSAAQSAVGSARSAALSAVGSVGSVVESAGYAARCDGYAARSAGSAANDMLTEMVLEEFAKQGLEV
jgi:hypothetical protein